MGRRDNGHGAEPAGPRDPRGLVSYIDVDAPKVRKTCPLLCRDGCEASMLFSVYLWSCLRASGCKASWYGGFLVDLMRVVCYVTWV